MAWTLPRRLPIGLGSTALVDGGLAVATFAASLLQFSAGGARMIRSGHGPAVLVPGHGDVSLLGLVLIAGSTLPLVIWRRFPIAVFAVTATAAVVLNGLRIGHPLDLMVGPAAALYLVASRERRGRRDLLVPAVIVVFSGAYLVAGGVLRGGGLPQTILLHSGLAWAVAWFAGERTRLRRQHIAELRERATRAEHDAERERLLAAAEERARIARDLHDSAGHAVSVIAVRAGAARLHYDHDHDPDRSRAALESIEELARDTAAEIDQIVGVLRDERSHDTAPLAPPGLASLDTLIARHTAAGLEVRVERSGTPRPLPDTADLSAYRILQETLTNAARHGTGTATVELAFGTEALDVTVTNPVPVKGTTRPGGGHGLIGMRERATLAGGEFRTATVDRRFRAYARIPYGEAIGGRP